MGGAQSGGGGTRMAMAAMAHYTNFDKPVSRSVVALGATSRRLLPSPTSHLNLPYPLPRSSPS
jgi:hypothetical protein